MKPLRLAALAAMMVAAVAVVTWVAGPVEVNEPRFSLDLDLEPPELAEPAEEEEFDCESAGLGCERETEASDAATVGAIVFLAVLLAGLVWLAVRVIRKIVAWTSDVRLPIPMDETVDAEIREALRKASEQAAQDIEGVASGQAGNAVVASWVRLERAAERVGTPRHASATPTEFTVELLREHDADPRAVATLLELYHQARFATQPLPESAGGTAAEALRNIAGSLSGAASSTAAGEAS